MQPGQHQSRQPGRQGEMTPEPETVRPGPGSGKLAGRVAIITGGDSGIGRAVAAAFAREGADILIAYLDEHEDAAETVRLVEAEGHVCLSVAGDVGEEAFCQQMVREAFERFERIDVLVNNAAVQFPQGDISRITCEQLDRTFRTNIYSQFFCAKAALEHMTSGGAIINTTSVTAYRGSAHLLDYSATKGAIVSFTRSLSAAVVQRGIRVNAVAPGPIWTPLIPATFPADEVADFGKDTAMGRPGQPEEVAPSYVFLASEDSSYMTGQVLHPNGGSIING